MQAVIALLSWGGVVLLCSTNVNIVRLSYCTSGGVLGTAECMWIQGCDTLQLGETLKTCETPKSYEVLNDICGVKVCQVALE